MAKTVINARDFSSREEIERAMKGLVASTPDLKVGYEISGKREELERLKLSDRTTVYGVRCVIMDEPTPTKKQSEVEKPQRGETIKPTIT